jgi:hypothetical protein
MARNTQKVVEEYRSSGQTRKEFCVRHGMSVSVLQYHLSKARKGGSAVSQAPAARRAAGHFVPVRVEGGERGPRTVIVVRGEMSCEEVCRLIRGFVD